MASQGEQADDLAVGSGPLLDAAVEAAVASVSEVWPELRGAPGHVVALRGLQLVEQEVEALVEACALRPARLPLHRLGLDAKIDLVATLAPLDDELLVALDGFVTLRHELAERSPLELEEADLVDLDLAPLVGLAAVEPGTTPARQLAFAVLVCAARLRVLTLLSREQRSRLDPVYALARDLLGVRSAELLDPGSPPTAGPGSG